MRQVGLKEAKAHLSALCAEALKGEVVIISNSTSGECVQLVPIQRGLRAPSAFGVFADKLKDLPPDYWTNPRHEQQFIDLFSEHE